MSPSPANAAAVPAFEVVDAVVMTPPPLKPVADTAPESRSPTVTTEADEPRERRAERRKKPAPSFWARHRKLLAVAGVIVGGLLVGEAVKQMVKGRGDSTPDAGKAVAEGSPVRAGSGGSSNRREAADGAVRPSPTTGCGCGTTPPVREKLEQGGAQVATAAGRQAAAILTPDSGDRSQAVPIDLALTPDLDVSGYAAVVFVGRNPGEYAGPGPGGVAERAVIERMRRQNRVVAAICEGRGVLAKNGVLYGKAVASRPAAQDLIRGHPEFQTGDIHWQEKGVVTDGKLVTAAYPDDAEEFAAALLKALE